MSNNNYKMFWDCKVDGCFNDKHRLKFSVFKDCFPGKISFTDIDGIVEINRNFLMVEWKGTDGPIPMGQRIMFERLSEIGFCIFNVFGNAENKTGNGTAAGQQHCR